MDMQWVGLGLIHLAYGIGFEFGIRLARANLIWIGLNLNQLRLRFELAEASLLELG